MTLSDLYYKINWSAVELAHSTISSSSKIRRDAQDRDDVFYQRCDKLRQALFGLVDTGLKDVPEEAVTAARILLRPVWGQVVNILAEENLAR